CASHKGDYGSTHWYFDVW
nr:immunoglobulin heavy chain junction region [Mus musculus]